MSDDDEDFEELSGNWEPKLYHAAMSDDVGDVDTLDGFVLRGRRPVFRLERERRDRNDVRIAIELHQALAHKQKAREDRAFWVFGRREDRRDRVGQAPIFCCPAGTWSGRKI